MRDLFERFQLLQSKVRALGTIVHDGSEPTLEQLEAFADSVDSNIIELCDLKAEVIEHFIA